MQMPMPKTMMLLFDLPYETYRQPVLQNAEIRRRKEIFGLYKISIIIFQVLSHRHRIEAFRKTDTPTDFADFFLLSFKNTH